MKLSFVLLFGIVLGLLVLPSGAVSQDAGAKPQLRVHVHYGGSGNVDEKHPIYVALWDSADFVHGKGMPVEVLPTSSKTGTVTFQDVKTSPAYVSAVFDPKGEWDGRSGPPPEGSSLGLHSKSPGQPEPINLRGVKTSTIELTFDDSVKMHDGQAQVR